MKLHEKTLQQKQVFAGNMIKLRVDNVELPNGKESTREVVEHPGAVTIIGFTPENELLLVRQHRYPIAQDTLELPAGKLDPKEDPQNCAIRELEEETGYLAQTVELLGKFYTTPGFSDELMYLYLAEGLQESKQNCDEDEFVQVVKMSLDEAVKNVFNGTIIDGKSMVGILWLRK